jgi:N-acetylmuramic acid 6-phosphate etherase
VVTVCEVSREEAKSLLERAGGSVKRAIVMQRLGLSAADADRKLAEAGGVIRRAIGAPPPPVR